MSTYTDVYFTYTLPVISVLVLIVWPFVCRSEVFKIVLIGTAGLIYTTPWNKYIAYNGGWMYESEKMLTEYIPVELYTFSFVQIMLTSLWALICMYWYIPCLKLNTNKHSYELIRWIPILMFITMATIGYIPGRNIYNLVCILFWISMWYGGGNYFVNMIIPSSIAITVPTLYLCWVDRIAMKNSVWHNDEPIGSNVFIVKDLLPEKTLFFFTTNMIVVLAMCCYDKARGMMAAYTLEFPERFRFSWTFMKQMFRAFITSEYSMPSITIQDIQATMDLLKDTSKTFSVTIYFFHPGKIIFNICIYIITLFFLP